MLIKLFPVPTQEILAELPEVVQPPEAVLPVEQLANAPLPGAAQVSPPLPVCKSLKRVARGASYSGRLSWRGLFFGSSDIIIPPFSFTLFPLSIPTYLHCDDGNIQSVEPPTYG